MHLRIECSKGTYIRQIADDIGVKLGCFAYLKELRRISSGEFALENALTIEDIKKCTADDVIGIARDNAERYIDENA